MADIIKTEVAVLGGGPGGYTAAFRAADLGKQVVIIERNPSIGGVCLHWGCIPSKHLLHAAEVIQEARAAESSGIRFGEPQIDLEKLRASKDRVVSTLAKGAEGLAKARNVRVISGEGKFLDSRTLQLSTGEQVRFEYCIIASGSRPVELPMIPRDDPRVWDSTDALELKSIPKHLVILGGGIIGLEMAEVYHALGSKITVVEMTDQIIPAADADLVKPLMKEMKARYEGIYLGTKVTEVKPLKQKLKVMLEGGKAPEYLEADALLVSVGRRANGDLLDLERAGLEHDRQGVITVDDFLRTDVKHIFAVGDVTGAPMLAHRAAYQGRVAAEVIAGLPTSYAPMTIPSVAYTHPEAAWMGLTEKEAKQQGIAYTKGTVPWQASGRALSAGKQNGVTKVLFDKKTGRIIGAGIAGYQAGELLAEAVLAMEMGADAEDISLTVHAHPTLSETLKLAAEQVHGSATDLPPGSSKQHQNS